MKVTLWGWPVYTLDAAGEDVETLYDVECDITPYDPGVTHRAPEHCYPPEDGECEIISVRLSGKELPVAEWPKLDEKEISDAAFQKASDDEEGAAEDHADAERERRLERD